MQQILCTAAMHAQNNIIVQRVSSIECLYECAIDIKAIISLAPVQVIISVSIKDTTYYLNASNPNDKSGFVGLSRSPSTTFFRAVYDLMPSHYIRRTFL